MNGRGHATAVAIVIALGWSSAAHADKADAMFKKGKKLLAAKKYAQACAAFEQVDKLDPGIGAKLNVAKCFEDWGRLAVAYRWYEDAIEMATKTKDSRLKKIKEIAEELDINVPRVIIKIPKGANPDVVETVTLDGTRVSESDLNVDQRVDPGPHAIEFTVDGKKHSKMAAVERGGTAEVSLAIPKGKGKGKGKGKDKGKDKDNSKWKGKGTPEGDVATPIEPKPDPVEPAEPSPPGRTRRIAGLTITAAGGVAMGVAGILTLGARSKYKDALADHCMGSTTMCDPTGLRVTSDARTRANVATVITIVGAAAVAGGIVLYVTAPRGGGGDASAEREALYLAPSLGPDGGGIVFGGSY